jgi:hypothetical protein
VIAAVWRYAGVMRYPGGGGLTAAERARPRLRGARPGTALPVRALVVAWRVSVRGSVMVGGQKIQVGLAHGARLCCLTVPLNSLIA